MTYYDVREATTEDMPVVAALIADSFFGLAAAGWLVPDPAARRSVLRGNFGIFAEHALTHGHVHLLTDQSAVAVWFTAMTPPADYHHRLLGACGPYTDRFRVLDALFDAYHPAGPDHHYLAFLAVAPDRQRTGRGSTLLRHHHARLDAEGVPAYLEAASRDSRDVALRHGYEPYGVGSFLLPDGTTFFPMWRAPTRPLLAGGDPP